MNKRATKRKNAAKNYILKFLTVSSVSSDSIVKGIIGDIIKTVVKTVEVDEQKTKRKHEKAISRLYEVNTGQNINNILLINMT
jgi:nucleoside diphosphate kinase